MRLKILAFVLLLSGPALAAEPPPRAPTGRWIVDFDDAQCVATRDYGTPQAPMRFFIKTPPTGDVMQMGLMRNGTRASAQQLPAKVTIGTSPAIKSTVLTFSPSGQKRRIDLINLASTVAEPIARATSIKIQLGNDSESLALSQMKSLLEVMDRCVVSLRKAWNVPDLGAPSPLKQRARGNLHSFFDADDYPPVAFINGQTGIVKFVALIDENGRVADCTLTQTSGVAALDAQTCAVLKERGKFEPAIGADGKPARDVIFQTVNWKLG
jgi:TonB family protein